ncbi:hypothetical protein PR001_g19889 [Phytophthora rubi]|uniref:Uncharacterized protein n=1 Tax=Phytophthora rubi TaxID=129364 RepID=A0A6A3JMY2_9STRA|nr:hypothetical protein PR001_g19889 [Phytophthora rubi]
MTFPGLSTPLLLCATLLRLLCASLLLLRARTRRSPNSPTCLMPSRGQARSTTAPAPCRQARAVIPIQKQEPVQVTRHHAHLCERPCGRR